tara:strand:+ start:562 stop:2058 length:1497 start_codon:yes stop_codon:yes gene_type:complete
MKRGLFIFPDSNFWIRAMLKLKKNKYIPEMIIGDISHKKFFKNVKIFNPDTFRLANSQKLFKSDKVVDGNIYDLLDESIFCSNICLTRFLPSKNHISSDERDIYFFKAINMILSLIKNNKFDFVVFASPPHRVTDQILFDICKMKKIQIIFYNHTLFDKYDFVSDKANLFIDSNNNFNKNISGFLSEAIKNISEGKSYKFSYSVTSPNASLKIKNRNILENFIRNLRLKTTRKMMYDFNNLKKGKDSSFIGYFFFKYYEILTKFKVLIAKDYYKKISVNLNLNDKYLYFPLAYQPEASTCPSGGYFSYNLFSIAYLINIIPDDYKIYCKIHPRQFRNPIDRDNFCDQAYLKALNDYSNRIKFLNFNTDSINIIKNSRGLITDASASTSFIEAMSLSKKVLSLNKNAYFRYFDNVLDLRKKNINKILVAKFLKDKFNYEKFLQNMSELERLTHDFSSYRISQQKIRHFVDFENENETKDKKIFTNFVDQILRNLNKNND